MYIWIYMLVCWMEMSVWFLSMANLKLLIKSNVFSASVCKLICCHMSQLNERIMKWMKSMLLCVSINIGHMLTECSYFVWCCKFLCEPDAKQFRETKKKSIKNRYCDSGDDIVGIRIGTVSIKGDQLMFGEWSMQTLKIQFKKICFKVFSGIET